MSQSLRRLAVPGLAGVLFLLATAGCTDATVELRTVNLIANRSTVRDPDTCRDGGLDVPTASGGANRSPDTNAGGGLQLRNFGSGQVRYHPDRLTVRAACVRVTGVVRAIRTEADGDLHIRVQLDSPFSGMLTPGNQQQCGQGVCGLLVVEPICVHSVTQADAVAECAADPDPLKPCRRSAPTSGSKAAL